LFGAFAASSLARADEIVMPAAVLTREHPIDVAYRLASPGNGNGVLAIEWTDALGRVAERRKIALHFAHAITSTFRFDMRRAAVMQNRLSAHLSFKGITTTGAPDLRENDARISFVAQPIDRSWSDYQVIMWQPRTPTEYAALKKIEVTAGNLRARTCTPRPSISTQ
jgi:hypothetical protein